jgi:cell division protein FtsI/penicillin-binding protein 2
MRQTIYAPKGTGRRLNRNLNYTLAGKTGTAQVFGLDAEEQFVRPINVWSWFVFQSINLALLWQVVPLLNYRYLHFLQ